MLLFISLMNLFMLSFFIIWIIFKIFKIFFIYNYLNLNINGDWGLGIGDWGDREGAHV